MGLFNKHAADKKADKNMVAEAKKMRSSMLDQAAGLQGQAQGAMDMMKHMNMKEMTAYAEKMHRINANGADGTASVVATRDLGPGSNGMGTTMEFDLAVISGPGAPRNITVKQEMVGDLAGYTPGAQIPIRINAADPDEALIWGAPAGAETPAPASAPVGGGGDTIARLEALGKLRDSGALSAEEFDEQKARILAEG
jgi:hypothetical protein